MITSAGILLAAVFAVLGVLPLVTLTEIGVIVGIGVLLDTLLVRTLLVPSIVMLLGDRFWWPSRPARRQAAPAPDPVAAAQTAPAVAVTPTDRGPGPDRAPGLTVTAPPASAPSPPRRRAAPSRKAAADRQHPLRPAPVSSPGRRTRSSTRGRC